MSKRETNDARKLRAVAAALRDWGRKAGPPGRDSSTVPDEEREAARQALGLAVKNLDIITQARDRYGCAEGVVGVEVFERLGAAASAHDRGGDLGSYWVWVDFLTRKHLPGDVSFPDELDRWASRLEQEPVEGREGDGEGRGNWFLNFLKGVYALTVEKVTKGIFDSATKRP